MAQPQPSTELASMLPGPRFEAPAPLQEMPSFAQPPAPARSTAGSEDMSIAERRDARRERRRLAQANPGEGRNARNSGTGEPDQAGYLTSPTRPQQQQQQQFTPPRQAASDSEAVDMTRYGLAPEPPEAQSPLIARAPRRRMSSAGGQSVATGSEDGSQLGSPTRRQGSRADLHSSADSLDSLAAASRSARRGGSGFKRGAKGAKAAKAAAAASSTAQVHVIGEIVGASGFSQRMLFCRWQLLYEPAKSWQVLRGAQQGATHACCSGVPEEDQVVWEHPIDLQLQTQSLQGWPALLLMVYERNEFANRDSFVSYGLVGLPSTPGLHAVSCHTWFAVESDRGLGRSFFAWYTGLIPRLEDEGFITDLRKREDAGAFIATVGAGRVHLRLGVIAKHLDAVQHRGGESLAAALERLTTSILSTSTALANKTAALQAHRQSVDTLSEGQRLVREGREERMAAARAKVDARRRGDGASPAASESSRTSALDPGGRSSFRGFGGGGARGPASPSLRRAGSDAGGPRDDRSELSYDGGGGSAAPRDRYAARLARRAAEKALRESQTSVEGGSAAPSGGGAAAPSDGGAGAAGPAAGAAAADAGAAAGAGAGTGAAPSRQASGSGSGRARTGSGRGGGLGGGAGARGAGEEDDGLETIGAEDDVGAPPAAGEDGASGGGAAAGRAAARAARRAAAQRQAF